MEGERAPENEPEEHGAATDGDAPDRAPTEPDARTGVASPPQMATRAVSSGEPGTSPARRFFRRHRVRIARLALLGLGAFILVDLAGVLPTQVRVSLPLGAGHAEAVALSIDVLDEAGEPARSVRLRYADGAPATVEQSIELAPGLYAVHVEAERADGSRWSLEGPLEAPAEGTVRVPLQRAP